MGLRTIKRCKDNETVRMVDLKKGDIFEMYEPDGILVGKFVAFNDGFLNEDGIGTVEVEPTGI